MKKIIIMMMMMMVIAMMVVTVYDDTDSDHAYLCCMTIVASAPTHRMIRFRRCSCVAIDPSHPNNPPVRRPCIPPHRNYMCLRECVLFKKQLVRVRDKNDRLWEAYKMNGLNDAMKRAEHEAKLYLDSMEGELPWWVWMMVFMDAWMKLVLFMDEK